MRYVFLVLLFWGAPYIAWTQAGGASVEESPAIYDDADDEESIYSTRNPADFGHPTASMRTVDDGTWKKSTGNLDYRDDVPEAKKVKEAPTPRNTPNFNWDPGFWRNFFKVLAIIFLVIIIGIVIYQAVQSPGNHTIRASDGTPITMDNLDAYIQETDLERFLREALAAGNYNQAVRIYYLQVIKDLSQKDAIHWSREKTNRDYLREMRSHPLYSSFRSVTTTYEEVWYGNVLLDQPIFNRIEQEMKSLISSIKPDIKER